MAIYVHQLRNDKEIEEYRNWLKTKETHKLETYLLQYEISLTFPHLSSIQYPNINKRIDIINEELELRLH